MIKSVNPAIHLQTHVLYGFPTETRKDFSASFALGKVFDSTVYFFYTPKMYRIIRENRDLVIKYRILQDRIALFTALIAMLVALLWYRFIPGDSYIVGASVVAASAGFLVKRRRGRK